MRSVDAQAPLAAALWDHFEQGLAARVVCVRAEGMAYEIETTGFFEAEGELAALEQAALTATRGRVLDVGAGAGRHALALQERGHEVVAIDVSERCVALMRQRGVTRCLALDAFGLGEPEAPAVGRFDTILLLMQSIGIAGSGLGVEVLLGKLAGLLAPGGQILLDSSPLAPLGNDEAGEGQPSGPALARTPTSAAGPIGLGEVEVHFEYRDLQGEPFSWIYLDEGALRAHARASGLRCQLLARMPGGSEYLARLQRA